MGRPPSTGAPMRWIFAKLPLLLLFALLLFVLLQPHSKTGYKRRYQLATEQFSSFLQGESQRPEQQSQPSPELLQPAPEPLQPSAQPLQPSPEPAQPSPRDVKTANGTAPIAEIEEQVFKKFGYTVERWEGPFAVLSRPMECSQVFEQWSAIANTYDPQREPPRAIPADQLAAYTLNGYARLEDWYLKDVSNPGEPLDWNKSYVDGFMKDALVAQSTYGVQGGAVQAATAYHSIRGMKGLVIGSLTPWVEAICLNNGAATVVTADYQKIVSTHPQLSFIHVPEMAKDWQKYHEQFDFIVSFSSIEHSGLGRYGDPSDPIGDLREMDKMKCFLKKGGLLFLGFPVASDAVIFNAHRVYGRIRLSMVFEGFELLNMFAGVDSNPAKMTDELFDAVDRSASLQPVFVLRRK